MPQAAFICPIVLNILMGVLAVTVPLRRALHQRDVQSRQQLYASAACPIFACAATAAFMTLSLIVVYLFTALSLISFAVYWWRYE